MMDIIEKLNTEEITGFSISEVSQRLSLPENTLRKYLAYFDLEVEKKGRKNYLSEEVVQCLSEILQLKSNSWSLKQIKVFRETQKNKANSLLVNKESEPVVNIIEFSNEIQDKNAELKIEELKQIPEIQKEELIIKEIKPLEKEIKQISKIQKEKLIIEEITKDEEKTKDEDKEASSEKIIEEIKVKIIEKPEIRIKAKINIVEEKEIQEENEFSINASNFTDSEDKEFNNSEEDDLYKNEFAEIDPEQIKQKRVITIFNKPPLTKDYVNKEIATQAKRASRLYRFLSSRSSPRDSAEIKTDLNRRVEFLNGLRYIRDNWLDRPDQQNKHKNTAIAN